MSSLPVVQDVDHEAIDKQFNFSKFIKQKGLQLSPQGIDTLQVNLTKLCNQACLHCHVDSGPKRTESMDKEGVDRCLDILQAYPSLKTLDITGGAPELNPHFDYFVQRARELGKHVMARHNLTVTIDGNPVTGESKRYIPEFYARWGVEVVSSLPYYEEYFTDKQRGRGVFQKSIEAIRLLNEQGFGHAGSEKILNLVYNPVGAFLPASQESLEQKFKSVLKEKFDLVFNNLFVITNMPIHRFKTQLKHLGQYEDYMNKLVNAFNPTAAEGVMCRNILSISHDGQIYDCDFNQMLELPVAVRRAKSIYDFDYDELLNRQIVFAAHCFGCTAGAGSSCGGETA